MACTTIKLNINAPSCFLQIVNSLLVTPVIYVHNNLQFGEIKDLLQRVFQTCYYGRTSTLTFLEEKVTKLELSFSHLAMKTTGW